jgi:hypothetical protein
LKGKVEPCGRIEVRRIRKLFIDLLEAAIPEVGRK